MAENPLPPASTRARRHLAAAYVLLILYASLSPFTGWRDQGLTFTEVLAAPLWLTYTPVDALINVFAYMPLGALLVLSLLRCFGRASSVLLAALAGMLLSAAMEYAQMYLPARTSSNLDILTNTAGTLAGAVIGARIAGSAWFATLTRWRHDLMRHDAGVDFGLALAALWMFAQINPSLPMLGNIFINEPERAPFQPAHTEPFAWLASVASALNLLMVGCLYMTLLRQRRHALVAVVLTMSLVGVSKFLAAAILFKSWALLLWLNGESMLGILAGLAALVVVARMTNRLLSGSAALAALGYLVLGMGVPDAGVPPGLAHLYYWREGHFMTYNGLSHFILLLFPLLLLGYLWRTRKW